MSYDTIVISGGAVKGFILLGALQCAWDNLLVKNIKTYVGTSVGAMIGYLLAIGYTPVEIIVYICTNRIIERMQAFNLIAMLNREGAISYHPIQETLEKMTLEKIGKFLTMKELEEKYSKRLVCATYNNTKKIMEYISPNNYPDLPCLVALRMSANVPMLFERFRYMEHEYVDGGIADNYPIITAEKEGTKILGFVLLPEEKTVHSEPESDDKGFLHELFNLMYVPINQTTKFKIDLTNKETTTNIVIPNGTLKFFDFSVKSSVKLDMFSSGYQTVKKYLDEKK